MAQDCPQSQQTESICHSSTTLVAAAVLGWARLRFLQRRQGHRRAEVWPPRQGRPCLPVCQLVPQHPLSPEHGSPLALHLAGWPVCTCRLQEAQPPSGFGSRQHVAGLCRTRDPPCVSDTQCVRREGACDSAEGPPCWVEDEDKDRDVERDSHRPPHPIHPPSLALQARP